MKSLPDDFFRPPPPLTLSLLKASQRVTQERDEIPHELLWTAQEDIALRLWGGLASLARAHTIARGRENCSLHVSEARPELSRSLQRRLALPPSEHALVLVESGLLGRFFYWLQYDKSGEYPAAWGVMRYDGEELSFSGVHVPRFLSETYRKAESLRDDRGQLGKLVHAE